MTSNTEQTLQTALSTMDINRNIHADPINPQGGSAIITWNPPAADSAPQTIQLVQMRDMSYDEFRNAIRTGFRLEERGLKLSHLIVDVHTDEEVDGDPIGWEEILFIALSRRRGVEVEIAAGPARDIEVAGIGGKLEAVRL